jgi:hypothetical protein
MPVFVVSCIVEMIVPYKSIKIGCRVTKQVIGLPFLTCCLTINTIIQPFEKMGFGESMPTRSDITMLDELTGLKEQAE